MDFTGMYTHILNYRQACISSTSLTVRALQLEESRIGWAKYTFVVNNKNYGKYTPLEVGPLMHEVA